MEARVCLKHFQEKSLKVWKQTTLRWELEQVPSIYSEIGLTPPGVSGLENCGSDESSAEVTAVVDGYMLKK